MPENRKGSAFERALSIVYEGLREARANTDRVRTAARSLEIGFMDVIAVAIAREIVEEFKLSEEPIND